MTDVFMDKGGWTQTGTQGGHGVEMNGGIGLANQGSVRLTRKVSRQVRGKELTIFPHKPPAFLCLISEYPPFRRRETPEIPMVHMAQ